MKCGRNMPCPCNSGKKYKVCCLPKNEKEERLTLFERFEIISDPRDNRGKRYLLKDLLIMVIYGVLNGHDCFDSIAFFLRQNEPYFKNLLLIKKHRPMIVCPTYSP